MGMTRRRFIQSSLATGSALVAVPASVHAKPFSRIIGANDTINIAIIGLHGRGRDHIEFFSKVPGVRISALCEVDSAILNEEVAKFKANQKTVASYTDYRKVLDDKEVDAVTIATPNHWHSLMAIWACQAGKDVYVEKPVSHNVWEGRKLVEAARKYNRIVQAGIQSRSDKAFPEVIEYLKQGNLGKIIAAYGLCYKRRESIGKVDGPQPIPQSVDYNLWSGPAPLVPLRRSKLHYDWHWQWAYGNGDIGNQGAHQMDQARRLLGQEDLPKRVMCIGGRFGYDDDGETANSQVAIFDYEPAPLIFEVQGLPRKKGDAAMGHLKGIRIGVVVKCENGYFAGGGGGGWVYDNNDKKIQQFVSDGGENHYGNFIEAVRSRKAEDLNGKILEGHISASLSHLANISYRLGQLSAPDVIQEAVKAQKPAAMESLERFEDNLFSNWIDLAKDRACLGPLLDIDSKNEKFVETGEYNISRWANDLLSQQYRAPFLVPEKV